MNEYTEKIAAAQKEIRYLCAAREKSCRKSGVSDGPQHGDRKETFLGSFEHWFEDGEGSLLIDAYHLSSGAHEYIILRMGDSVDNQEVLEIDACFGRPSRFSYVRNQPPRWSVAITRERFKQAAKWAEDIDLVGGFD